MLLSDYQIVETIHEGASSRIYRAQDRLTQRSVILKLLNQVFPDPVTLAWFRREYQLLVELSDAERIVKPLQFVDKADQPIIVLEDDGGQSLDALVASGPLGVGELLSISVQAAEALSQIHQRRIVHKDITPANLIYNRTDRRLKVIDFGIASQLSRETLDIRNPDVLEGTLAYISPEQTGRMNRVIDYRSDFYALGATLFHLATGRPPFTTTDSLELIHAHIVKQPPLVHDLNGDIPPIFSDIVMKLMAKNAEERYRSANGIVADLRECSWQWHATDRIEPFAIGIQDIPDQFEVPQRLYGREAEVTELHLAVQRVANGGSELVLISGLSGVGKSALVREAYKPITAEKGYFIGGKFEQFRRETPYGAFIQAFRALTRYMLAETEERLERWRARLSEAVGGNLRVITDVVPEMTVIVGEQEPLPALSAQDAQSRFHLAIQRFVSVFARPEHPLVLYLDDLQWADRASIKLMTELLSAPFSAYLLIIAAYRDNEVLPTHPFQLAIEEIREKDIWVTHLKLKPLTVIHTNELLADAFYRPQAELASLAELVHAKTGGNPFFTIEFLRFLNSEKLISFDYEDSRWVWNIEDIRRQDITDNVVELMMNKIQRLQSRTSMVLKLAACIGNRFDLITLSMVYGQDRQSTARDLWEAVINGIILPQGEEYKLVMLDLGVMDTALDVTYRFAHDRLQQAVYNLIPESGRQTTHWQIGTMLLENRRATRHVSELFELVDHLNSGFIPARGDADRQLLVDLNWEAARQARSSNAFDTAVRYASTGIDYLGPQGWSSSYQTALSLHSIAAEAAFLSGDLQRADQLIATTLDQAQTLSDKVHVYGVQILMHSAKRDLQKAVDRSLEVLAKFGVVIPAEPQPADIAQANEQVLALIPGEGVLSLKALPTMTDEHLLAVMRLLENVVSSATYIIAPRVFVLGALEAVRLSIVHGRASLSAFAYVTYGMILAGFLQDVETGFKFGQLGVELSENEDATPFKGRIWHIFNTFVRPWGEDPRRSLEPLLEAFKLSAEAGDIRFAPQSLFIYTIYALKSGCQLLPLHEKVTQFLPEVIRLRQPVFTTLVQIYMQVILNLIGESADPLHLVGEAFDAESELPHLYESNNRNALSNYLGQMTFLTYIFQHYEESAAFNAEDKKYSGSSMASWGGVLQLVYDALVSLAVYPNRSADEQETIIQSVDAHLARIKGWAVRVPEAHAHQYELIAAEKARVLGDTASARERFDRAIDLARRHEAFKEEAVAFERAALFYRDLGYDHLFASYMRDALFAYRRWGAEAKVSHLQETYPNLFMTGVNGQLGRDNWGVTQVAVSTHRFGRSLDLESVLRASQTISSTIMLEDLMEKLLHVVLESAGAERVAMLLEENNRWLVAAEATVTAAKVHLAEGRTISPDDVPISVIQYVLRTRNQVLLDDAMISARFMRDPYIIRGQVRSVLALPLLNGGQLSAILYLENNVATAAFTPQRLELLNLLSSQAAIALDNARLYSRLSVANDQLEAYSHKLEDMVSERTEELETAVAELDAFSHTVAHDLKGPLGAVIGYAEMISEYADDMPVDEIEELSQQVVRGGFRMRNIIDGLLTLAMTRDEELPRYPLDMMAVVSEIYDRFAFNIQEKQAEWVAATDWPTAIGHQAMVEEVWANYISNAFKYGGRPPRIELGWDHWENDHIRFWVRDNGDGLSPEQAVKVFMPFNRLKHRGDSHGLGLSIVERIVTRLGGRVGVESQLGEGALFYFTLPHQL